MVLNLTYNDFNTISDFLDMRRDQCPPVTDLNVEVMSNGDAMRGLVQQYWDGLSADERYDRTSHLTGRKKSDAEKEKISRAQKGRPKYYCRVGGTLQKDGVIVSFDCMSHFCKEHKLSVGNICELLQGKRKSVKGWTNVV